MFRHKRQGTTNISILPLICRHNKYSVNSTRLHLGLLNRGVDLIAETHKRRVLLFQTVCVEGEMEMYRTLIVNVFEEVLLYHSHLLFIGQKEEGRDDCELE